jgi:4'-phosphopantetheinyl transferase
MPSLVPEEIHLRFVFCEEITAPALLDHYRSLLSQDEKAQELRFYFPADRHRYLLTRALVRTVLSQYVPVAPEAWAFGKGEHGRPYILNKHPAAADLSFNISHTRELVLLGVTHRSALGVDTENARERVASLELADRFFSPAEAASLRALPTESQQERFFDYWTLKESYIKARGRGLSIPLDLFTFQVRADELSLTVSPELESPPLAWNLWLMQPCANHVAAVCAQRIGPDHQQLITRKVVPLVDEQPITCVQKGRNV